MSKVCVVCKEPVPTWSEISDDFEDLLDDVDRYGVESLTENLQVVYHGEICSYLCYERLS